MANKLDIMDLKQIINLHLDGNSNREISRILGLNINTVNNYINSFKSCDIDMEEFKALNHLEPARPLQPQDFFWFSAVFLLTPYRL
jgi:Trp operon repressor